MKKLLATMLLTVTLSAQAFTVLVHTEGGDREFHSENVKSLVFNADGSALLTLASNETATISGDVFQSITFSDLMTDAVVSTTDDALTIHGSTLTCGTGLIEVIAPSGITMLRAANGSVDISSLSAGLYIVKTESKSTAIYLK